MASRPHDGSEPEETGAEPGDPGRPDLPDRSDIGPLPDPEVEARWTEIITHLGEPSRGETAAVPDEEPAGRRAVERPAEPGPAEGAPDTRVTSDPRGWAADDVEEHFEPPDPGPVFGGDPLLTMAWIAVVVPPVLLVLSVLAWRDMPSVALRIAGVVFLIGVGVLLWRMPASRDEDDGPGAVV